MFEDLLSSEGPTGETLVDTHCHLTVDPLSRDTDAVLRRADAVAVRGFVVPSYDRASLEAVRALSRGKPGVHAAYGLHPWVASEELDVPLLEMLLRDGGVAVGEIGLDYALPDHDRARQRAVLERQLDLACALGLPAILHCRKAEEDLLDLVRARAPSLRGIVHAFSRGPELAERYLEAGLHIAFGGAITRPRAERARRSAALVPIDRILLETDSPSIGLEGIPAVETEPRHVATIARTLAALRGVTLEEVARATTANASALFGIDLAALTPTGSRR
jgi:TatD DNase family protein